jgi:hypothetical protein
VVWTVGSGMFAYCCRGSVVVSQLKLILTRPPDLPRRLVLRLQPVPDLAPRLETVPDRRPPVDVVRGADP